MWDTATLNSHLLLPGLPNSRFWELKNKELHFARNSCDPKEVMKILLGILAVLVVAVSLFADYKWRQWMAARRRDRQ
jgi:hypothetical protein